MPPYWRVLERLRRQKSRIHLPGSQSSTCPGPFLLQLAQARTRSAAFAHSPINMVLPSDTLERVASSLTLIAVGFALKTLKLISREDGFAGLRFVFGITLPAVLLQTFSTLPAHSISGSGIFIASIAHACALAILSKTWVLPGRTQPSLAVISGSCWGVNLGTFAYPFTSAIFGDIGLSTLVLFDAPNHVALLLFQYLDFRARMMDSAYRELSITQLLKIIGRRLCHPCMLAIYISAILVLSKKALPVYFFSALAPLAGANSTLALLSIGATLDFKPTRGMLQDVTAVIGSRIAVSLLVGAAIVAALQRSLSADALTVLLIACASPVPTLTLAYADSFQCDSSLASVLVNTSIIVSILMLVFIVKIYMASPKLLLPAALSLSASAFVVSSVARKYQRRIYSSNQSKRPRPACRASYSLQTTCQRVWIGFKTKNVNCGAHTQRYKCCGNLARTRYAHIQMCGLLLY